MKSVQGVGLHQVNKSRDCIPNSRNSMCTEYMDGGRKQHNALVKKLLCLEHTASSGVWDKPREIDDSQSMQDFIGHILLSHSLCKSLRPGFHIFGKMTLSLYLSVITTDFHYYQTLLLLSNTASSSIGNISAPLHSSLKLWQIVISRPCLNNNSNPVGTLLF